MLDTNKKLKLHLEESNIHIDRLHDALNVLEKLYPLTTETIEILSLENKDKLDVLAFRFSKLQDLLGTKIFREYLEVFGINVGEFGFFDILKLIEKEKICDIDTWNELRKLRNDIAHDYPHELDEMLEKINLFIKNSDKLVSIFDNIKRRYDAISK